MSNIFTWETQDVDLKECIKLKTNCQQNDTMILQFNIYDYDNPVDLTNLNISFVAKKPDGTIYGQAENITKSNNSLTITCSEELTSVTGRVVGVLIITDNSGNRKGSYFIVFNIFGIVTTEDRVVTRNFIDVLEHFDEDIAIALKLSTQFKQDIIDAQTVNDSLGSILPNAHTINDSLTQAVNTASILEPKLSANIANATILEPKLSADVTNAETKLAEFKSYDTTNLVPLSNTMLNNLYCSKELLTLQHDLNGYPQVKIIYSEYGGTVDSSGNITSLNGLTSIERQVVYDSDKNNLTIYVPEKYYITSPTITKINNYKYKVTFANSIKLMIIELLDEVTNSNTFYETAGGTATAITLGSLVVKNGYAKTFIAKYNNNGSSTTVNGYSLYKPNTTNSPNLIAGKAYTIWYSSTSNCFFWKASAEGTTIASHVLAGDTFSNYDDTGLIGTMPNIGTVNKELTINETYVIPKGYHDGSGKVTQNIPNRGEYQYAGGIGTGSDYIAFNNIPYGYYPPSSNGWSPEIRTSMSSLASFLGITQNKIVSGNKICGVDGTATIQSLGGKRYASSTATSSSSTTGYTYKMNSGDTNPFYTVTVTGLSFYPSFIYLSYNGVGITYFLSTFPDLNGDISNVIKVIYDFQGNSYKSTSNTYTMANVAPASVSNTGFSLPVAYGGQSYNWFAIE